MTNIWMLASAENAAPSGEGEVIGMEEASQETQTVTQQDGSNGAGTDETNAAATAKTQLNDSDHDGCFGHLHVFCHVPRPQEKTTGTQENGRCFIQK